MQTHAVFTQIASLTSPSQHPVIWTFVQPMDQLSVQFQSEYRVVFILEVSEWRGVNLRDTLTHLNQ